MDISPPDIVMLPAQNELSYLASPNGTGRVRKVVDCYKAQTFATLDGAIERAQREDISVGEYSPVVTTLDHESDRRLHGGDVLSLYTEFDFCAWGWVRWGDGRHSIETDGTIRGLTPGQRNFMLADDPLAVYCGEMSPRDIENRKALRRGWIVHFDPDTKEMSISGPDGKLCNDDGEHGNVLTPVPVHGVLCKES